MRVRFEAGSIARIGDELQALGLHRAIVLCTPDQSALADRVVTLLGPRTAYATGTRGPGAVVDEAFRQAGLEPPEPVIIFESLLALPDLVAHSDLLATVPRRLIGRGSAWDALCVVPVTQALPTLSLTVLRRASQALTPAANELLGWIRQIAKG
jgi:DNA-binding transcriptional LysR family regulator